MKVEDMASVLLHVLCVPDMHQIVYSKGVKPPCYICTSYIVHRILFVVYCMANIVWRLLYGEYCTMYVVHCM